MTKEQNDNTRVFRPIIIEKIPYKLKPNELYFIDKKTGKKTLVKRKQETVTEDRRSNYQRQQDWNKTKQIQKQQEQDKNYEKGIETINSLTKLTLPSTYVGPLFNNNGKSYTDNLISGEGTGSAVGNAVIDGLTPFAVGGINKGIQVGNRFYRIRQFSKAPKETSINVVKENAYKLSDQGWDQIYEAALNEGNTKKLKELRALHFQVKSGNDPQVFAHSTNNTFNRFDKSFFGQTDEGFHGSGFYFTTTRVPENPSIYKIAKGPNGEIPYMNYGRNKKYFYLKGNREYKVGNPMRNFFEEANTVGFVSPKDSKVSEVIVGQPTQIKSTIAITYDDNGNFIPLSKRDDFANPDFRYKKGAKILIKKKR